MKRSGAIGVVVAVLAVAALLMYFVVMPQMKDNKTVEDLARKAGETVEQAKKAVNDAGKQVEEVADGTEEARAAFVSKMARLKSDADAAAKELETALAKTSPSAEEMAAARTRLEAALKAATDMKLPEGVDDATKTLAGKASEGAKAALDTLNRMPTDPAAAKAALTGLKASIQSALPGGDTKPAGADDASATKPAKDVAKADGTVTDDAAGTTPGTIAQATDAAKPADDAKATDDAKAALPAFDIVRVEKDGSTVIAGRADPRATVEIIDGGKVIAEAQADETGAFAAVLDDPLAAGDHSITIRSTAKDGKSASSEEVATVSVPKDAKGELLAMVTKPGEASKIITMPEGDTTAADANQGVTAVAKSAEMAKATDGEMQTPDLPALSSEIAANPPIVSGDGRTETDIQRTVKADTSTPADAATTTNAEPAEAPEVLVSAVEIEGDKIFVAGKSAKNATIRVYADDKLVAEVKADDAGNFVADNKLPLAVGNHTIRADVVAADGKVAVRASVPFFRPEGDLAAVASADPVASKSAVEPVVGASFDKARDEAGKALGLLKDLYAGGRTPSAEELAAARSSTEIALKTLSEIKVASNADPDLANMASKAAREAAKALDTLKALPADVAAVKSALETIEKDVGEALRPAAELAARTPVETPTDETLKPADAVVSAEMVKPADTASDVTKPAESSGVADTAQPGEIADPAGDKLTAADAAKPDATEQSSANAVATDAGNTADGGAASGAEQQKTADNAAADSRKDVASADQPKTIEQAPLTQSRDSVIIRRGDTLWQISRRVYGKGVRYTTIYVANQSQITDPDRIMPGQIFSMPGKWLDNAEELHKERLEHKKK